ncbi:MULTISPECIES: DUF4112 domain-containing protein [unclassified Aureimonas]|uniref:DUF4112 domain-containing protein n=1 Tax=unclassified Aureimonas TaxID=2615206 RepID=UPI0006FC3360|nr:MULTISPECIES: DUF4112 domain-containing protein [unclassified Aureimonas]KQT52820.1 hypothetical protein ASG62_12910 [Aureimonas sp. Leaf427]KQT80280.1 hypothetical protein ASG54_06760 [Aureimonas sp. Leaf460]
MVYSTTADAVPEAAFSRSERIRRLKRISRLARLMDTAIRVPVIGVRFGADSVMGLVPGIGDAAGGLIGLFIINEARKLGLPRHKIMRMVGNVGLDVAVGSVPLLGDVFDVYFKAHKRNANMILDHFPDHRADLDPELLKDITPKR